MAELATMLMAEHKRAVLVVLQGMDASGKDGTVKHCLGGLNPMSVRVAGFKAPNSTELAHDFLWRIHQVLPQRGEIGIFNRSHYEDVLVVRVEELVPKQVWKKRYAAINAFEQHLANEGTTVVKLFLHISQEEQAKRFRERIADPTKNWKFSPDDLAKRERWDDYMTAYRAMLERTSTDDRALAHRARRPQVGARRGRHRGAHADARGTRPEVARAVARAARRSSSPLTEAARKRRRGPGSRPTPCVRRALGRRRRQAPACRNLLVAGLLPARPGDRRRRRSRRAPRWRRRARRASSPCRRPGWSRSRRPS